MKRTSIWTRNLSQTTFGSIFQGVAAVGVFFFLLYQGTRGLFWKETLFARRFSVSLYTGTNAQILGAAYLSICTCVLLYVFVGPQVKNPKLQEVTRIVAGVLLLMAVGGLVTAVIRENF